MAKNYERIAEVGAHQESKERRQKNALGSAERLRECGISFLSKNNGTHLIVTAPNGTVIDFWPSTGRWIPRAGTRPNGGRGVFELLKHIGVKSNETKPE